MHNSRIPTLIPFIFTPTLHVISPYSQLKPQSSIYPCTTNIFILLIKNGILKNKHPSPVIHALFQLPIAHTPPPPRSTLRSYLSTVQQQLYAKNQKTLLIHISLIPLLILLIFTTPLRIMSLYPSLYSHIPPLSMHQKYFKTASKKLILQK